MSPVTQGSTPDTDLSRSPRFVTMSAQIAEHLMKVHNVEDLERAVQLYAVVENAVFEYVSQENSKLSEQTLQTYTAWLATGKKKLTRT